MRACFAWQAKLKRSTRWMRGESAPWVHGIWFMRLCRRCRISPALFGDVGNFAQTRGGLSTTFPTVATVAANVRRGGADRHTSGQILLGLKSGHRLRHDAGPTPSVLVAAPPEELGDANHHKPCAHREN
ncbi:unnamed protein product [Prorocentrum cordatum]|uniref:Uncharacterized protein n=1 Tax=Prorocentrum cordatum TaxID=2364126 RepID=A0ABN9W1R0_9DINO|nr:unnamed protein product [Polarella glacialis]